MAANGPAFSADDDFDDDELDDIPSETFAALERDAIAASQLPAPLQSRPSALGAHGKPPDGYRVPQNYGRPLDSDSRDEEQVINLADYSHGQRTAFPPQRRNVPPKPAFRPTINNGHPRPLASQVPQRPNQAPPRPVENAHLQPKVQQLERELAALRENASTAESRAQAKSGEAAILRQRLDKSTRDYEQKIEALRQAEVEAAAKHRTELDSLRRDREKAETDRRFLEHDLAVEVGKTRQQTKPGGVPARTRTLPEHARRPPLSPRKAVQSFGDGFDDHEVVIPSPSPSKKKAKGLASFDDDVLLLSPSRARVSKPSTPTERPEKRRKRDGSPSVRHKLSFEEKPLDMSPPDIFSPFSGDLALEDDLVELKTDDKLEFLQNLVDMRVLPSNERLLDALSSHWLPSLPGKKMSSMLLDQLTGSDSESGVECTTMFSMAICDLWTKCLHEKYYAAIDIFVDALHFVMISNSFSFLRTLVPLAVSPALRTVNLVAYPISEASYSEAHGIEHEPAPSLGTDLSACFELLSDLATACAGSAEHVTAFWEIVDYHSALVFLAKEQPIHHVSFMCKLLSTSGTDASFGPIIQKGDNPAIRDQSEIESLLVERLSSLLFQLPSPPSPSSPRDFPSILTFRLQILGTRESLSSPPRTGASVAAHPAALGRLGHFLHATVDALYSASTSPPRTHALAVSCVNAATLLLHALLAAHAVDMREKLKAVDGGAHMHLVALTRVAFCEAVVLERGVGPAASDAAHALLDEFLSPFEGEQLLQMYPTADSTAVGLHDGGGAASAGVGGAAGPMVLE